MFRLAELESEKEFVPSEYVLNKLKEKGIEVVTDKEEFERILESQNILQKLEPHSTEEMIITLMNFIYGS